ncbi:MULTISPECIES: organoarsenical effux MFS transporter ArsJ [unclassified Guyparkeria]|uniref:organoarsenical effux MFS transporter ArsJ n=1 Tax=unclassified Guyparkeria TaxID=2626246 RepID=UPI0007334221|nr:MULTISPECIES: organoarsenical effux MFS transporter ArsJ [unclassified Guyparkeria]KTG17775.1 MFS transporter permease [Guyparkeria sp. XI15]OAE89486.1 MFS transporter permease [Guyparkeria sp. WRN-7]
MPAALRHYLTITGNYWLFTLTDGAIRMLVVLHFYQLGYSPFAIAMLFLFYEFFGIVTNLVGGWLGARIGLNRTMQIGTGLQILALLMLTVPDAWLSVAYVMVAQALSGVAKDLNKMSAKAGVKLVATEGNAQLFRWVAWITGSKNALKGAGFFLGAVLLSSVGFQGAMGWLAAMLFIGLAMTLTLPGGFGAIRAKKGFAGMFSREPLINWLAAARIFLFAARDVWFVVALPVFLVSIGWDFHWVGAYLALWVIGYGIVQALAPRLLGGRRSSPLEDGPTGRTASIWTFSLALPLVAILAALMLDLTDGWVISLGLAFFGIVFAINSATHSYLILRYSALEKASMNVGFYYAANASGRLLGTVLSGLSYQWIGIMGSIGFALGFVILAGALSLQLARLEPSADNES